MPATARGSAPVQSEALCMYAWMRRRPACNRRRAVTPADGVEGGARNRREAAPPDAPHRQRAACAGCVRVQCSGRCSQRLFGTARAGRFVASRNRGCACPHGPQRPHRATANADRFAAAAAAAAAACRGDSDRERNLRAERAGAERRRRCHAWTVASASHALGFGSTAAAAAAAHGQRGGAASSARRDGATSGGRAHRGRLPRVRECPWSVGFSTTCTVPCRAPQVSLELSAPERLAEGSSGRLTVVCTRRCTGHAAAHIAASLTPTHGFVSARPNRMRTQTVTAHRDIAPPPKRQSCDWRRVAALSASALSKAVRLASRVPGRCRQHRPQWRLDKIGSQARRQQRTLRRKAALPPPRRKRRSGDPGGPTHGA
jgi:hypothetical protein